MDYNVIGFILVAGLAITASSALGNRLKAWYPPTLLTVAVALRVLGSTARYETLFRFYNGFGDAVRYYWEGLQLAGRLDMPGPALLSADYWIPARASWWGTMFITRVSGMVLKFIGPTMRGEFLAFALLSFVGLYLIAKAFRNTQAGTQALAYTTWLWCWPSLWFWPASVGKEAILILAMGLFTYGYASGKEKVNWLAFGAGLFLAFCVRPHVAAVLALSAVAAYWLGSWDRLSFRRVAESLVALGAAVFALRSMAAQFGLDITDAQGVSEFVQFRTAQTLSGGSQIGAVGGGLGGIPMAFVNIWMRPFPWDVHNATALIAAAEILVFWWLVWRRRAEVGLALRNWRRHRLLRLAVPLLLAYTLMIGLTFSNLGIIARQRSPIFPFMFMIVLAAPATAPAAATRRRSSPKVPPVPNPAGA